MTLEVCIAQLKRKKIVNEDGKKADEKDISLAHQLSVFLKIVLNMFYFCLFLS